MEAAVILPLNEEQSSAIDARSDEPVRVVNPKTNEVFVLLRADDYDRVRFLLDEEFDVRDSYAAQFASAIRAGWGDPGMDDYDNYDEAYRKLCQSTGERSS